MSEQYYKPCAELERCNELIEKYFNTQQYDKSHFGNLKSLLHDDRVILTDMDGNELYYEAVTIEIFPSTAIEDMISSECDLSPFTCTLRGSARVTVRCDKLERL